MVANSSKMLVTAFRDGEKQKKTNNKVRRENEGNYKEWGRSSFLNPGFFLEKFFQNRTDSDLSRYGLRFGKNLWSLQNTIYMTKLTHV